MKVITNKKHEDTIDLEDVDLDKHYVVFVAEHSCYWVQEITSSTPSMVIGIRFGTGSSYYGNYRSFDSWAKCCVINGDGGKLHAFNTLHVMLDFVKENTDEKGTWR